jgi:hypothetical protein
MFPDYYSALSINDEDLLMVHFSWQTIINNLSPKFLNDKRDQKFLYSSCIVYFHDSFFSQLFELRPDTKLSFKGGIKNQGKFLTNLIWLAIKICSKQESSQLTNSFSAKYYEMGFKALECKYLNIFNI